MPEFVARNMQGWIIKINKRKSCRILLVIYIAVPTEITAIEWRHENVHETENRL